MIPLDPPKRLRLFREMLRIRLVEETIAARYAEQQMRCPVHLSIGQEGIAVGICAALGAADNLMSTHRAHAHYLAKGGDLRRMIAELYGRAAGCTGGRGGSMHLVDLSVGMLGSTPIVGSSLPVAVGVAFATWMEDRRDIMAVFFGEGTTEEGVFAEAINFAALKKLPVLFVCENNLYSVYSPMEVRQSAERDRLAIAAAHGIWGAHGDGNQVEEVYRLAGQAVTRIREGMGPAFLEFSTYRWREHCGPHYDNHIGYRTEAEFLAWKKRCPIETYGKTLRGEGVLDDAKCAVMTAEIQGEIDQACRFALESPYPDPAELMKKIYAEGDA
jgi:pyruvate dehydrogenase E1 component alpha subunit